MLANHQKLQLRRKAHHLSPVVILGQEGYTAAVKQAIDEALLAHELIKIRVNAEDKSQRQQIVEAIVSDHQAELIQRVGHVLVIYRKRPTKK